MCAGAEWEASEWSWCASVPRYGGGSKRGGAGEGDHDDACILALTVDSAHPSNDGQER